MPSAGNTFLTNSIITKAALAVLENTLNATKVINREYDDQFRFGGAVLGQTLNIRKPARFMGRLGMPMQIEGIEETYVPLTLAYQRGVDTQVSSQDLILNIDEYTDRILKPQIARLANLIDQDVWSLALGVGNHVGVPGATPSTINTYWSAKTKLDNGACPMGNRYYVLNPAAEQGVGQVVYTNYNPQKEIGRIYEDGSMGYALGADWRMDQNVFVQTTGTVAGSPIVNGVSQSGSSIITSTWTSTTLNIGDVISFSNTNSVNPQSYASTGQLAQFTVTGTVTDSGGAITIPISPAIVGPGSSQQNVDVLPTTNDTVLFYDKAAASFSTVSAKVSPQNLMFHKDFGTLACVDLPLPDGTDKASRQASRKAGLSLRYIRDFIASSDQWVQRFDVLYGITVLRPELACRISG